MIERALSIRQPWAWAILHAGKGVENRTWGSDFRGEFFIHASKGLGKMECRDALATVVDVCPAAYDLWPGYETVERGGIVGVARIVDCRLNLHVGKPASPWEIAGQFSFLLADVRPLPFVPCSGMLGFWRVPADVLAKIQEAA